MRNKKKSTTVVYEAHRYTCENNWIDEVSFTTTYNYFGFPRVTIDDNDFVLGNVDTVQCSPQEAGVLKRKLVRMGFKKRST